MNKPTRTDSSRTARRNREAAQALREAELAPAAGGMPRGGSNDCLVCGLVFVPASEI